MSEVKSLEGWPATVDHRLDALISFNDVRRQGQHQLAESIGKNRAELNAELDTIRRAADKLRSLVHALLFLSGFLFVVVAVLAVVVLT